MASRPKWRSTASPAAWPCVSLMRLKWSMSSSNSVSGRRMRSAWAQYFSACIHHALRDIRPVRKSVLASCSRSASMRSWMIMMVPSVRHGMTSTPSVRKVTFHAVGSRKAWVTARSIMYTPARTAHTTADSIATIHTNR
ncbi:hypothetical protein D3C72_1407960 [compost metagenome]